MTHDTHDGARGAGAARAAVASTAAIEELRVRAPSDGPLSAELLLRLSDGGACVLALSLDDLRRMLELVDVAMATGRAHPN